jgi:hypothetical protein
MPGGPRRAVLFSPPQVNAPVQQNRPIVLTRHARDKLEERGASESDVLQAIRIGEREPAQRGLYLYRLNLDFNRVWAGRYYRVKQVAPVVAEEQDRFVVVTVYTFYF